MSATDTTRRLSKASDGRPGGYGPRPLTDQARSTFEELDIDSLISGDGADHRPTTGGWNDLRTSPTSRRWVRRSTSSGASVVSRRRVALPAWSGDTAGHWRADHARTLAGWV